MPPSISVIFPMWNEEAYIHRSVAAARKTLEGFAPDHEIIIVNDASTDRTGELADALARTDPKVKVVHHARNRKLGGSLRSGYAVAGKELVLYSDADLPFDFHEVERAVHLMEYQQADVVSAYRHDRTSEGLLRTVYTIGYSALIRTVFALRFRDVNFSFKLFKRALLDKIVLKSEGSFIDAEFLVRARKAGAHVIQFGVDYFPRTRGQSTLASPGVILGILREMITLWRDLR
jgi:glycosyltransferase involved in cell wall biosynthesis